jgi:hypothetical protein
MTRGQQRMGHEHDRRQRGRARRPHGRTERRSPNPPERRGNAQKLRAARGAVNKSLGFSAPSVFGPSLGSGANRHARQARRLAIPDPERLDAATRRGPGTQDVRAAEDEAAGAAAGRRVVDADLNQVSGGVGAVAAGLHAHDTRIGPARHLRAGTDSTLAAGPGRAPRSRRARRSCHACAAARIARSESIVQAGPPAAVRRRSEHQARHQKSTPKHASHVNRSHDLGFAVKNQRRKSPRSRGRGWTTIPAATVGPEPRPGTRR